MNIEILKKRIAETLFPRDFTCDICGVETFNSCLCPSCEKTVIFNDNAVCPLCGRRTVADEICLECKQKPPLFNKAVSAIVHADGGALLINKFKNGNGYLKEYFADLLVKRLSVFPQIDGIVFVPMTKKAIRKRGYNQAELLAKSLSERTGIPVFPDAVQKVKESGEQKTLSLRERDENLKGCFKAGKCGLKGKTLLLVDDVMTTGITADTVTKVLLKSGAARVYFAAAASVEYKLIKSDNASEI